MAQINDPNNLYTRLRISNPLNFNQPTQQELFNRQFQENTPLQKELETRLDSVYRLSPNSEADSNIVDSAAVFMDLFDMDHEQALGLARTTFSAGLTNEARERMGFGQALGQTALNTFNQFSAGTNMAFYMIGGNDEHKAKALEKQSKIVNLWEDYGFLGNTVLSSIQPLGSSLRYMGTTALLRGGSALLARAIGVSHPVLATATFIAGTGLSFLANISITGLSQAGSDFLEYSQMADKNGTKLDLDSPEAKTLFWTSALVHGTIESIGSELLPGVRYLNKTIDSVARNAILKESWRQVLLRVALGTPVGIIGEGFEEFLAVYNTALTENSLKYLANKEGATFDYTTGREMVTEGWKAFTDGAVSMIIPSILTGALGGGIYNARTSAAARANFNKTEGSISIDRRYVEDVPKPTGPKEGDVQKPAAEREKLDPVKLVDVGGTTPKLVALNAAEREKLGEAAARNAEAVEAVIVEQEPLSVEDRQSLVNRAALATGGKLSGERIVYETKDDLEMAKILLEPVSTQGDTVTFRDEDGELVSLDLTLAEEGMDVTEADISYYEDPEAPHSLARMTQDKALEYQERKLIKDAIGNVVEHTGGRISNTDLEANVDAVKMVAETLNIPTDELLGKGVAFRLVDKVYDATGSEVSARGSIESNISIEGKKQYTINISKTADATTILHELGHTLRGLATDEQIRDFRLFYGKGKEAAFIGDINKVGDKYLVGDQAFDTLEQAQKLVEANEEAFANDFVAYLRTGQAPTADLKNIFARMKAVLNRFLVEFGYRLDPEVRQAFDNLLRRESQGLPYTGTIPTDAEGNVLFQQSPPVGSDEFKRIFGDSKVVTKSGEPILVYHGSPSLFKSFDAVQLSDSGYLGAGFYFSSLKGVAETYASRTNSGYIYNAYLVMNNPLMWNEEWNGKWDEIAKNILNKYPNINKGSDEYGALLAMELREMGYDGVLDIKGDVVNEAVVFDDKQVLLNGIEKYNLNNTLFQLAPPTDSEAFKAWFGDSKVVDENGKPLVVYHSTDTEFEAFDTSDKSLDLTIPNNRGDNIGSFFTTSVRNSKHFGNNTMEVYLSIQNPKVFDTQDNFREFVRSNFKMEEETFTEPAKFSNDTRRILEEQGYDGVIIKKAQFGGKTSKESWYIAFSPTQIKSVNNTGTWDPSNPNILFQEAVEKINNGSLAVLHNISADKLVSADEIGGLPSPSLAITRPDIPFVQFGEITLIADPSVATKAMEEGRLYDRDVWSPTVPMAEWKINQKVIDKFDKKIMPIIYEETGKYFSGSDAFSRSDITRGPNLLIDAYKRTIEAQIAFLKDRGIDYELKFKKPKAPFTFPIEVIKGNLEYFRSTKFETENSDTVREYLRPKVSEYLEKSLAHRKENNPALYETMKNDLMDSYLRFGVLDKVFNFAKTYDKDALVFDEYGTQEGIRQTIKDHDSDFTSWIKDNINGAYTDPKIKIGSKKYEYTADNILKWMRLQSERASQDTMTYGPGKAASNAGSPFANREQVRDFEGTLITRDAQGVIWEETIKPLTESIQNELPNYNNKYSTWESLDAIYEAIGSYITKYGSTGNVPLMRKELSAKSFTKVPTWLLEQAVLLARRLATLQQDYFEAKPDRVVSLDEFNSAIVPNTISEEQKAVLRKHNISLYEYDTSENRQAIVEDIYANKSSKLLFQLSPDAKQQLLEARKKDVQAAIDGNFWVPTAIVQEYLDEEWAQKEMATREYLEQFPWMLEEARQFDTPDDYLEFIKAEAEKNRPQEQYTMTPEDENWHQKVFAYSRIRSPQDMDKQFVQTYARSRKSLLSLAKALKTYQDVGSRNKAIVRKGKTIARTVIWKWGAFKGVSPYVKNLTKDSSDAEFDRAKKLVEDNPTAYRKALQAVSEAQDRVAAFKGDPYAGQAQRDAYYDALGEEMLASLNEPLLLNEMTDREAAEYLRTSPDARERYNAREKLATHAGVRAMELQADAEVKRLGEIKDSEIKKLQKQRERLANELKETGEQFKKARKDLRSTESALEKERARSWELVEKLDEKSKQASKVNQLEKDLADRRARVKELRTQLTEKSREARRLNRQVTAYENREEARKTREKIERLMKVAYVAIKVSPSMDASYHPVFGWVQERLGLTSEYSKPDAPWKKKVDLLEDYLPRDVLDMLSSGIQIDQWSVEAMQALVDGMRMLQRQARIEGAYRADQTRMRRDRIALEYDRQTYGYTPVKTDQSIESVMGEIRDRLDNRKQNFYNGSEGKLAKMAHVFRQSLAHIWSFSEWLDGQKENGIMFKTFARTVWEYYQEEFRNIQRRLSAFDDVRKSMGYNQERLAKKVFTYTTPGGNEVVLNLEQAITAYIYSLNEKGLKKLIHASGNGMSHAILADMYQVLSEDDKQFAQAMIEAAGGDAEYMRLAEVFYRVYNHDLSREQNYFRFRAAGVEMENDIDLAKGIRKERFSFVEKGFGEDRTEAIYPLNLNGMKNLTKTIEEQEHLIHFGEWVRNANYLLGQKGSLGYEVRVTYGDTSLKTLQTFVKRIAGAQDTISDFERMLNNLITQVSSSLISANLSSMMKQAASMSYIMMGDISLSHAVRVMFGWSPTPEIRNWVHAYEVMCELDPSMKERTFDIEVKRSRNLEYTNKASRALAKIRDTGIKYTTQLGDSVITVKMWWGAYLTALDKFANMEKEGRMREAVFYASRFIAETQSSSNPMDLAEIQTSRHTWPRLISAFKRDAFKRWNLAFYKLPQAVRNRQWAKAGGIITSQLLGLLILAGVRGLFIKKDDDDDEKYRKFLMKNLTAQLFEEAIPYAGEGIASGILGFGGGDLLELDDVSGRWLGEFFDGDKDWEAFWKRSWELVITSLSTVGVPSLALERTIKSVDEMNFWRMIGGYWYKLGEDDE